MKKIIKIFIVLSIFINAFITPINAAEYGKEYVPRWRVITYYSNKQNTSDWFYYDDNSGWGVTTGSNAISQILIELRIDDCLEGTICKIKFDFDIYGWATTDYYINYSYWSDSKGQQIRLTNVEGDNNYQIIDTTQSKLSPNITIKNNYGEQLKYIRFEINPVSSQNLTNVQYYMTKQRYTINKTDELINAENNANISGIFETVKQIYNGIINLPNNIANSVKGFFDNVVSAINNIQTWLTNLLNGIIEGLKSLFIPNNDYFINYFEELYEFFTNKLGILMLPIDIIIDFFNGIMNISEGEGIIHINEIKYMNVVLIEEQDYNLKNIIVEVMGNVYDIYYLFVDMILLSMVLNMARKKFDEIIGGHSS